MIGRRQLTVASPISVGALGSAFIESLFAPATAVQQRARALVSQAFGVREVVLTDSGTSSLILALRLAVPKGGTVAYPAYACVDLAAAAQYAGVRVRLYDLDPATLGPDLDSLRATLSRGADAVVVAHLFGYPADVDGVRVVAKEYGVPIIEDAAQGAGGRLQGRRLGSLGDLSLVSFGRGKGLCAGGGGALLASSEGWESSVAALRLAKGDRGWTGLAKAGVQWALGRPALYAIPSMIPWLHLGQMVYHPATEPRAMDVSANALVSSAFSLEPADLETRRGNAAALSDLLGQHHHLDGITTIAGAAPGYLRLAVLDNSGSRGADTSLGIARPYPTTMLEMPELRESLHDFEPAAPGAVILRDRLLTLPTHRYLTARDIARLRRWITANKSLR